MRQSRPASAVRRPSSQCGALVRQGLAVARPRADPRVPCAWSGVTQNHSLPSSPHAACVEGVVSRAWFFAAWSWIPPCCVLCGCSVLRREHLVAGACASKVCTLRLSSGFALFGFPRSCTGLLWFFEFTSPSESGDQSENGCDRGLAFLASASGVHSRRSSVRLSAAVAAAFGYDPRG